VFRDIDPLGKVISVGDEGRSAISCKVIGILENQPSSQQEVNPNNYIIMPYSYFSKVVSSPWERELHSFMVKVESGADPVQSGENLEGYFKSRYGDSGNFFADSNSKLVAQMKLFLNLFSGLLAAIAAIALVVGGVGINNMMLVGLSERLKELGLRKALGATPTYLRNLLLGESLLICLIAGLVGLLSGFAAYQGLVLAGTKLIPTLEFEWIFEPWAFVISFAAIFLTGLMSGLVPALKAERLNVMEALRQDV
jgi:ABC-type antimicrobial peptide transport system permease subunit